MVHRCSLVVLFPEHPTTGRWGPGSRLVFRAALHNIRPVFVVASVVPRVSYVQVMPADLFGIVEGWWVVPHPSSPGGLVDDEF